ncbi:5-methyltetrahydropteroyltriglutamate--homocysteine S-methyltransferase [Peptoniphilus sp. MSJ-1]|uniref:5-methyltetrahydropteroyltriglutamate--homocysteine methyltransferase n=1 Tax=Peptoniphilus ovalis TaxID=2841503 RepID=A0ABS6FGW0_9FIRM|nr:5-methyltetrahydropteroyltriglutamate--homocysteine S-methyltransferase [Peptoniphilus ovalis]MBU5669411.1 5-methyltetrahydropteroyltriglutamate--homocysteine S-methyltransferase [Peptoniphilus ovalis]
MKTSIIGFPRVGSLRELKFGTEKFFRNEIDRNELEKIAKELRIKNLKLEKESGLDFIPSNDFSFYDLTLDAAVLINIIPKRYKDLGLDDLQEYFAMAKGYQGENGDVKALAMKKWFNTNYHYMVPEIDDETEVKLVGTKVFDEFKEAKNEDILSKPVLIGPYTLLKKLRYVGDKKANDFSDDFIAVYKEIIERLNKLGAEWIQFDEPEIVYDLTDGDKNLFNKLYSEILKSKNNSKILIQTYFGDVRDIYLNLLELDFDAIGLDFIEGLKTKDLIDEYGFKEDKILFAGLINGKNIWRNNYKKTLETIEFLKNKNINFVLNTSCSLLHVPYTLKNESKLDNKYLEHFSFAEEKLVELKDLKELSENNYETDKKYIENQKLFNNRPDSYDKDVNNRVNNIKEEDYIRKPDFETREKIQREKFKLPLFPTTTIGSFPQTKEVRKNRSDFKNNLISEEEYIAFNKEKIKECIREQEEIGIDVLVHGEFERNDMVEYFGERLNGFLFTEKAWVQSYGTRCVKPPIIWGDVFRKNQMTVFWSKYAKSLTNKEVKGMLTGPVTILNWSFPREDIEIKEQTLQIALAIRDEVLDLEKNGINIIQVDEAALREKLPLRKSDWFKEYLAWAIPAFRLVHSGVKEDTQIHTHMCYSEFTDIIKAIDDMDADVISFEASRSDLQILDSLKENNFKTQVGPGVYDIHSPRIPSKEELVNQIKRILEKVSPEKLWINPDCGLKTRGNKEVRESLKNLLNATREVRDENNRNI